MHITLDLNDSKIIEKIPSKFGNGAHILISKELIGNNAKIILGNSRVQNKKILLDFSKSEIIERKIKKFSTGAHIIVPKEYSNKKIKIILGEKYE